MLTITIEVSAPAGQAIGIKEALAMYLERWGDCRVVSVEETQPRKPIYDQIQFGDLRGGR